MACFGVYPSLTCIKQGQVEFDVDLMMVWIKTIILMELNDALMQFMVSHYCVNYLYDFNLVVKCIPG